MVGELTKGEVALPLGGATYTLQYSIAAICDVEELREKPIGQIAAQMAQGWVGAMRAVVWAGLREHHPDITIQQAGELLRGDFDPAADAAVFSIVDGDRLLTVQFSVDTLCLLEDLSGRPFAHVTAQLAAGHIKVIRSILWAGLRRHHPEIGIKPAGELLLTGGQGEIMDKLRTALATVSPSAAMARNAKTKTPGVMDTVERALKAAFPQVEAAKDGDQDPPKGEGADGTGSNSTPSGAASDLESPPPSGG